MIFQAGDSKIEFIAEQAMFIFSGSLRLANMSEYDKVAAFLNENIQDREGRLLMDFRQLQFLNSSGITTLSLFILGCKKKSNLSLTVKGDPNVSWQQKSLANFKKLWSDVSLDM